MATQGPNFAGTGANDTAVGTRAWSSPGNIVSDNGVEANATSDSGTKYSNYLKATNFGFSIPTGATIDGIVVDMNKWRVSGIVQDHVVSLVVGGAVVGDNKGTTSINWLTEFSSVNTYGGASDKWGLTPTVAQVNASDFGVVLQAEIVRAGKALGSASVDYISITIHYTAASGAKQKTAVTRQAINRASFY